MTLPLLPAIAEIRKRLRVIFPEGLVSRPSLVSEMAARVCYVFLYIHIHGSAAIHHCINI